MALRERSEATSRAASAVHTPKLNLHRPTQIGVRRRAKYRERSSMVEQ